MATDFTGRTVSGKTVANLTWTVGGVADPGNLTAVDEVPTNINFAGLFDTPNAQGHFAPDKNTGNEGPWSVSIPIVPTVAQITIEDVVLDWQHLRQQRQLPERIAVGRLDGSCDRIEHRLGRHGHGLGVGYSGRTRWLFRRRWFSRIRSPTP